MNRHVPSVEIDDEIREKARLQAEIWKRESNKPWAMKPDMWTEDSFYIGAMGEFAVCRYLGFPLVVKEYIDFNYDIKLGNLQIDVKTSSLHEPLRQPLGGGFRIFVSKVAKMKTTDTILFAKLEPDHSRIYLVGWIWRKDLEKTPLVRTGNMPVPAYCVYLAYTKHVDDLKGMSTLDQFSKN